MTGRRPSKPIPIRFDTHFANELTESRVAPHGGGIDRKQQFDVVASAVRQRGKAAQRARRGLKQNHRAEVDSRRDIARCPSPV